MPTRMPALMPVRALDGDLVPGYRTLNVLGVMPERRGVLYHRLFSSTAADSSVSRRKCSRRCAP